MKPRNISTHPRGLLVQVERKKVVYRAWVPCRAIPGTDAYKAALARAEQLRDHLLRIHGDISWDRPKSPHQRAYSNTGLVGVSETTHWVNNRRPQPCFRVSWSDGHRMHGRSIYYGPQSRTRAQALAAAAALRTRMFTPSLITDH